MPNREMHSLCLPDKDGDPLARARYWIGAVRKEGLSPWPDGYLVVLSVIVGYRRANEVENADLAEQVQKWELLATDSQTGEFEGVQLFRLMREAETDLP